MPARDPYRPSCALDWCALALVPILIALAIVAGLWSLSVLLDVIAQGVNAAPC